MLVLTVGSGARLYARSRHRRISAHPSQSANFAGNPRVCDQRLQRALLGAASSALRDECLAGKTGIRGKDFNMRWVASMVAEVHRILMRGGVFMYPRDSKDMSRPGRCA
jgi:fructose-1,6-bisphosphatase I/sedoheptulose-1,7-bisphosphatase